MKRNELERSLLASVSRSFYLSVRVLPSAVRAPIGLAYLLARSSDTIADSANEPVPARVAALEAFGEAIRNGGTFSPEGITSADAAEDRLLRATPDLLQWLQQIPEPDRADISAVLDHILRGQRDDLLRRWPVQSEAELEEYLYLVAGCVGEFWTRICIRHIRGYSRIESTRMERLGVEFGKALQLVNVLRDIPGDQQNGRCYIPGDVREGQRFWHERALAYMESADQYTQAVRPWRLRLACILPWALGQKTLRLLEGRDLTVQRERVKVPRSEVRKLLLRALPASFSQRSLDRLRKAL